MEGKEVRLGSKYGDFRASVLDQLLKLLETELNKVKVPTYAELTIETLYSMIKDDETVLMYLPDRPAPGKKWVDRTWAFNVVNSVKRGFIASMVRHANTIRAERRPLAEHQQ